MNSIVINIIAGCATQAVISLVLWHRNLLSLPGIVERIETAITEIKESVRDTKSELSEIKEDVREIKAELREMRSTLARMNERIDKLIDNL